MTGNSAKIKLSLPVYFALCLMLVVSCPHLYAQKNTIGEKKIEEVKKKYELKAVYPRMEIPKDALMGVRGTIMDFNAPIEQIVNSRTDEFRKYVKEWRAPEEKRKSTMALIYETVLDNNKTYSIKLQTDSDIDFAAHPNTFYDSYNFDFINWTPFTIKDIFIESSNYLNVISDYSIAGLLNMFKEDNYAGMEEDIKKGASPDAENFKTFNFDGNNLVITFQYYQIGPRLMGAPEVKIPLDKLKDILNPAGPLGSYIQK